MKGLFGDSEEYDLFGDSEDYMSEIDEVFDEDANSENLELLTCISSPLSPYLWVINMESFLIYG